jgi:CDP-diacylglycerol--glycerol-3-phosphate 3-phosphatidyltransferase
MSLRRSSVAEFFYRLIERRLLPRLNALNLKPDHYTALGLLLAAFVPAGFYLHPLIGFLFIGVSGIADTLDGMVARQRNATSDFGAFLDSSLDRLSDFCYLCGFWILFWKAPHVIAATFLIFLSLLATEMISYVKARAESLGVACECGWMERGWRTVYLLIWALMISVLPEHRITIQWAGLVLYLLLAGMTVVQRIAHVRVKMTR